MAEILTTSARGTTTPRIRFDQVEMRYGATLALADVSFDVAPGEVVGLLGHNGAGKSTLMNVATGAVAATGGTVSIDGVALPLKPHPGDIADRGVSIIRQEPTLIGTLSVLDNLYLKQDVGGSNADRRRRAEAALARVGSTIQLDRPVDTLAMGEKQLVDLARGLLARDTKILMLDEPTAALGDAETKALHALIRQLAASGVSVIYISHRLPDILDVCERVVVLREGTVVLDRPREGLTARSLSSALAPGVDFDAVPAGTASTEMHLEVRSPFPLTFRHGEVVGLFGMAHGEQFDLLDSLFGNSKGGDLEAELAGGAYAPGSPRAAMKSGVHLIPADRDSDGLLMEMTAQDNVFLPWTQYLTGRRVDRAEMYSETRRSLNILGPSGDAPIASFSGGNRQKHLIARWIHPRRPKVLLLAQPTQGVDVGAKVDIRRNIWDLAQSGVTVIVASAESDEIASLCSRAYVLAHSSSVEVRREDHSDFEATLLDTLMTI